ncbi:uncharacterized protein LOC144105697 [Amblyomma americanum]
MEERLHRMARTYCWLMPRYILRGWRMFLLNANVDLSIDCPTLLERIAAALRLPEHTVTMSWYVQHGTYYACLLTEEEETRLYEHKVVCITLWSGLPLLAVRLMGASIEQRFRDALKVALLGDSFNLLDGIHDDLNLAFSAGRRFVDRLSDHLSREQQHRFVPREAPADKERLPTDDGGWPGGAGGVRGGQGS